MPRTEQHVTPSFLITIDTEGDNLWAAPRQVTTENALFLRRFQRLCEQYGLRPTYLTNYEMARSAQYQEFARAAAIRGTAEIGMHLHAWNSPPDYALTADDIKEQPLLIDYPAAVMREKIHYLTGVLEETFGVRMRSHRAGRWGFNAAYARLLAAEGYLIDTSVTPFVCWRGHPGAVVRQGGGDYTAFPSDPYWLDLDDISRAGNSPLLEIPVTIEPRGVWFHAHLAERGLLEKVIAHCWPPVSWLRPNGRNLSNMLRLVSQAQQAGKACVNFMLHSSELMPGGSPYFRTARAIEKLYADMEALFAAAAVHFRGATLHEYYSTVINMR